MCIRDSLKDQASSLSTLVKQDKEILQSIQHNIDEFLLDIPNLLDESVPKGEDETSNKIIEEIAQREKDLLKTDTEEQLELDLRKPIEDKKPVKEEQLELDLPAPRKRPTIVEEDSGQIGFDFDKKPKNTKEAVEKIIKERIQDK